MGDVPFWRRGVDDRLRYVIFDLERLAKIFRVSPDAANKTRQGFPLGPRMMVLAAYRIKTNSGKKTNARAFGSMLSNYSFDHLLLVRSLEALLCRSRRDKDRHCSDLPRSAAMAECRRSRRAQMPLRDGHRRTLFVLQGLYQYRNSGGHFRVRIRRAFQILIFFRQKILRCENA